MQNYCAECHYAESRGTKGQKDKMSKSTFPTNTLFPVFSRFFRPGVNAKKLFCPLFTDFRLS
jgi:hypothetical protein